MPRLPLPPRQKIVRPRHRASRVDPYFGYGYNPVWPSILSVAHDEANGARLLVILDRPCLLGAGPLVLPLRVPDNGAPLAVVAAENVLPAKIRVTFAGAVPLHAPWRWGGGVCSLFDPITGDYPNAASGDCADWPGPYTPPAAPVLVQASFDAATLILTLGFDRAINLDALDAGQITVDDAPQTGRAYVGSSLESLVSPSSFTLQMMDAGSSGGMAVLLLASGTTGIVSADEGGVWEGTGSGVGMPLGES